MDPIHQIIPVPPNIPPIAPAPMIGRVDRDAARHGPGQDKRRRRPPAPDPTDILDGRDDDDDSGLHINVTA